MRYFKLTLALLGISVLLGVSLAVWAGPLSTDEVLQRVGGVPTTTTTLSCSTTSAVLGSAIPTGGMVRLVSVGGSVVYRLVGAAGTTTTAQGPFLPQNLVEYVQNGNFQYVACITISGTATLYITTMQ